MLYEIPYFLLKFLLYVIFVSTSVAAPNDSLCFVGEKETFSCFIKNKTVSICETDKQDFFYRYGTLRKYRNEYFKKLLNYSTAMFSGGGESRLTFNNGAFDYVVFSAIYSLGPSTPEKDMKAGIIIVKEGTEVNRLLCTNPVYADFELSSESSKKILDYKANAEKSSLTINVLMSLFRKPKLSRKIKNHILYKDYSMGNAKNQYIGSSEIATEHH